MTELYAHLLPDYLARAGKAVSLPSPVTPAALEAGRRWGVLASQIARGSGAEPVKTVPQTVPQPTLAPLTPGGGYKIRTCDFHRVRMALYR